VGDAVTWAPEAFGLVALAEPKRPKLPKPRRRPSYNPSGCKVGIASLPGFAESLRLLLVEEEYTLEDVGQMFGVSRERIRQIANREGFHAKYGGMTCVRIWQDDEHRFRPVHKGVIKRVAQYECTTKRKQGIAEKYQARWAEAVAELKDLARQLERTPTLHELARRLGLGRNTGLLTAHLWTTPRKGASRSLAFLYENAGLTIRGKGGTGHRFKKQRQSHCRKGHEMTPENTKIYRWKDKEIHVCAICRNAYERHRYRTRKAKRTP
jgi:hypothetical protein